MDDEVAARLRALVETVERLRAPGGCPWDREQTHRTLAPFLEEETHEVVAAIEAGDAKGLAEELGDLLVQVAMHATVAAETGAFGLGDVAAAADAKMVRRHPHVFGGAEAGSAADVLQRWERLKASERGDRLSLLDGVPTTLPACSLALAVQRRPARVGLDPTPSAGAARLAVAGALDRLDAAAALVADGERGAVPDGRGDGAGGDVPAAVGALLFAVVGLARHLGVDPEHALRQRAEAHRLRVARAEAVLRAAGHPATLATAAEWEAAWAEAGPGAHAD